MIVTNLIGGLGNQLFQYACGHALAQRHGMPCRVATDLFEGYRLHQGFEVSRVFAVDTPVATAAELRALLGWLHHPLARRLAARWRPGLWRHGRVCFETATDASALVERLGADAYLHGYWQSERFFATQADSLRHALQFRAPLSARNAALLAQMAGGVSVSLHMRRGDYVSNPKNRAIYAECGPDYYRAAIDHLLGLHPNAHFYVFSDDLAWARGVLAERLAAVTFVDHNRGADSHNDLRLMSHCHHHVIANSSFSWWAAWLGEGAGAACGKIVVAPRRWYLDPDRGRDLVPDRWLRL